MKRDGYMCIYYIVLQDDWDGLDENNKRMRRIYLYIVIQDENEERRIYV